jgi:hypothetical protein
VAQCLVALAAAAGEVSLLQDGNEVQRLLAFRHGEQRARLGWSEAGLRRELAALGELIRAALRRRGVPAEAWSVVSRFLHRAEEVSVAAFCTERRDAESGADDGQAAPDAPAPGP